MLDKDSNAIYSIDENKNLKIESIEHGSYSAYDVNNNGEIIYSYDNFTVPQEVYILKNQKPKRLTSINKKIINKYRILSYQKNTVKTGSAEIDSWIVMPSSYKEKIPAILEIHGGPKTAYGNSFMLEFQILAAQGYGVIFSNPRGSDGYGEEFCDIRKKYGTIDYEDLMAVMDFYEKNYDIDSKRTGVTGGSYGGFMTNYIVTKTNRFKAAVTQRSISNWFSMYGTSDIGYFFTRDQIGFEPWENKEEYIEKSPLFQVKNVKTPLLLIHSFEDYRCWVVEAMQFFTSLRVLGVKSKLVIFKGENHELSRSGKPFNRVKRYNEILKWFRENL
jgi:dipeptidyl aminopeptidase/acylaminoacyl peptidase